MNQGRSDTFIAESNSKYDLLNFLKTCSTATVTSIKEIVYSKEYGINFVKQTVNKEDYYKKIKVHAISKTKAKVFTLYFVKKSITKEQLLKNFKKLYIDDEQITDIANIIFYRKGFSPSKG